MTPWSVRENIFVNIEMTALDRGIAGRDTQLNRALKISSCELDRGDIGNLE